MAFDLVTNVPGISSAANSMGLGALQGAGLIFKRKFRWTMEIEFCNGTRTVPKEFVKVGSRPNIEIEETQIDYLHGRFWLPGKATWQSITVSYYDLAGTTGGGASLTELYGWIASIYDIGDPVNLTMGSHAGDYYGDGRILLFDGCGTAVEGWLLGNMFPTTINWGELDMGSSDECVVELTLRYSQVSYKSFCPLGTPSKCPCTPCS